MAEPELPSYRDLPLLDDGARSAWGLFGPDDSVGLMNLLTPERIVDAAGLVRRGAVFRLDLPLGAVTPAPFARGSARHTVLERNPHGGLDDVIDGYYPQSGSQWDSLAHVPYSPDAFYNGATRAEVKSGQRNTVDFWASRGLVGRAVVLDLAEAVEERGGHAEAVAITADEIETARAAQGVDIHPGDILLLRTGWLRWYEQQQMATRESIVSRQAPRLTGLAQGEAIVEYLWDLHIAGIASDTVGLEAFPRGSDEGFGFLHRLLIGQFGMGLGELWALDALADDCIVDEVRECLLVSAPMFVPGGIGSPANAVAIK
jgi:kynurenine formamidase